MEFPQTFGPYEVLRKIASGGMAEIYLARLVGLGGFHKNLVLKMIHSRWSADEAFIQMLVEEAKLAVQLNHTNIARMALIEKWNFNGEELGFIYALLGVISKVSFTAITWTLVFELCSISDLNLSTSISSGGQVL